MLIIDKPAGLPVHAGPGGGDNLEKYFEHLRFGLPRPPALAHRLDRDTSGCLVLGRHRKALAKLGRLFQANEIEKIYWAIVIGHPPQAEGRVDLALKKQTRGTGWRMTVAEDGQAAVTDYRLLGSAQGLSWLELRPHTGRTHQIRAHCAALGCPLLGDPVYAETRRTERLHLLSRSITVPLYPKREAITAVAPVPEHMVRALRECGFTETVVQGSKPCNR